MTEELKQILERVEVAERMAAAGTYEQELYVKAALFAIWPRLRAAVRAGLASGQDTEGMR